MRSYKPILVLLTICFLLALFRTPIVTAFSPQSGDSFHFSETTNVSNGTGPNYNGYTEQTTTTGTEQVNSVSNGNVSAYYSFTWTTVNNQGLNLPCSSSPCTSSGNFIFSSSSFLYLKGTDNQSGYGYFNPKVWFAMDNSLPQGGTFTILNTLMTVKSTNYTYHLASMNENVYTIHAQGGSSYDRNDSYGKFRATYIWDAYFDPTSGYIVGYNINEQDTNSTTGDGFSYADNLSVTSTSYPLSIAPSSSTLSQFLGYILIAVAVVVIIIVIAVVAYTISRRRRNRLPKQLFQQVPQQYPTQPPPQIDLTPTHQMPEQIVIKEIVKVKCRYCGALIDGTVQTCPFCGAPRT